MSNEASILYLFYLFLVPCYLFLFSQVASRLVDVPAESIRSILCSDDIVKIMTHIYPLFLFQFWYSSCFDVKCWFHTFLNRCSHISMGVQILLDHQDGHVKFFSTGVHFVHSKLSLFPHPPTLFILGARNSQMKYPFYSCDVSSFFFPQCSYPVIYREDAQELQVHHSFVLIFFRWM